MSANAITSGAVLPNMDEDYSVVIVWAFVWLATRSQAFDWW